MAELLLTKLRRPDDALREVTPLIEAGPVDAAALAIVYRALEHPEVREHAAALLERAASGAEDDGQKLTILKTLLDMPKLPALEDARRRWFGSLLDLYESQPEVALETALAAVAELPHDEALWARVEKLARGLDRPDLVAAAYRSSLDLPMPPATAAVLGRRAVDYQEEWFDDPQAVILLLRRVLDVASEASWARDRLKLAYGSAERWDELFALYDDAVDRAIDEGTRAELLAEAAQAAKDFAGDADRAIAYFERFLGLRPNDHRVRSLLERLYEKQGRIQPLIDLLSGTLASLTGEQAQKLRVRIAWLFLRGRRDDVSAFKLIEDVLREEPARADAFALLEEIVLGVPPEALGSNGSSPDAETAERPSLLPEPDAEQQTSSMLPPASASPSSLAAGSSSGSVVPVGRAKKKKRSLSVRERAASMLKERYHADSRHNDLARVLEVELSLAASSKERARRHQELLSLKLDTLKDDYGAFEHAAALLTLEPRVSAHRQVLGELAERLSAWEKLAEVLVRTAEGSSDAPLVVRLLIEAGEIYRDRVSNDARAIELFSSVLALNPKDKEITLATARELDVLLQRASRFEERCSVLEKIATLATEPGARRAALTELSLVARENVHDPDRAIRAWRSFLDEVGADVEGLEGLISVLRSAERWGDLVLALEAHAQVAPAAQARADLVEVAGVHGERLHAPEQAVSAWSRVRQQFGTGPETFEPLATLFESMSRWDDLATLVMEETRGLVVDPAAPDIEKRLGEMKAKAALAVPRVVDRALATGVWQEILDAGIACFIPPLASDTSSEAAARWADATWWALDELVKIALDHREYDVAFRRMLDGSRIIFDPARSRQMQRQAALVASENLGDASRAVAVYRDLLAADEDDAVAEAVVPDLARLLGQLGAFADLVDLWEHQAARQAAKQSPTSADLWTRAAELSEKRLSNLERAIANYEKAAAGSPNALRELARLHTRCGEHAKAAAALEGLTYSASQEHMVVDVLALVDAYVGSGDRERARQRLEKATEIAIQPKPLRARLREFYREDEEWNKLADLLRVEAEDADDKPARLKLLREAADLHLTKRNAPGSAIPLLEQARKIDPDDQSIGLALTRALVATSRFEEASAILRAELDRYGNRKPKERALLHFELARVSLKMSDRARALAELDLAAKIAPAHPAILSALGKLSAEEGQLDRAQRTFRALLLVLGRPDPDASVEVGRSEVLFELAAIARRENDADRAEELIDSALHAATENEREARSLEKVLREQQRHDLLVRLFDARLAATTDVEPRASILRDLVLAYGDQVGLDLETKARLVGQADQVMQALEETTTAGAEAWVALETAYERLGESARQAEILERVGSAMAEGASPAHAEALYRLAKLRCQSADTLAAGVALLERALEMDARPDQAARVLVTALEIEPTNERYVRLYEKVSRGEGKTAARRDALVRLVELGVATPSERRDAVALALGASDDPLANSILTRILERSDLDVSDSVWAKTTLAQLCLKSGDLPRATDLAEQAVMEAPANEGRALLLEVAKVAMGPQEDLARAARIYAALRKQTPADRDIWGPLLEIYRKLEATDQLILLIAETLPLIESPAERGRLRLEQATALLERPETQDEAARLLREVLEDDPAEVGAAMLLSGILERGGRTDELVALLEHQLDAAKDRADVPSIVSFAMRLGTLLEERNRGQEAFDVYRAALDWDPKSKPPLYAVARLAESRGDPFEIAESLEKLVAVETGEAAEAVAMRLFTLRSELGDIDAAERALEAGLKGHPTSAPLSELLIARYQTRGAYEELSTLLKQAFERAPENLSLLGALLDAYRRTGSIEAAREAVTTAIDKAPHNALLYLERATLSETLGMSGDALSDFEMAFAVGGAPHLQDYVQALKREALRAQPPDDRPIKLKLAEVLCAGGFADAGRTHLTELLKRDGKDRVALAALAELEFREERWDAASATYRRLLPLEEGDALVDAALRLADACERASRLPDARSGLERAWKASPANAAVRARLEDLYEKTGAHVPLAQLVLAEASEHSDVSGRFALLMRAATLLLGQEGNPAQAVQVLEEARTLRPEDDEGILLLGRAYLVEGRTPDALALFQSTVLMRKARRSKQLSAMHREISRIHLQEGDLTSALEALTRAFDMDLHNGEIALELGLLAKDLDEEELAARAFRSVTFMKAAGGAAGDGATPAAKGLSYFFLGQMARKSGDVRKARLLAQKAVIEYPNLEQARVLLEELKSA
jgi:tetratricopeptide (TPR) repeat protein